MREHRRGWVLSAVLSGLGALAMPGSAQAPKRLTLNEAEQIALRNHPRIQSANLTADAAKTKIAEARAAYYPQLSANVTGVGAEADSTVGAGAITTSSMSSRLAGGVALNQLVTDFGRTGSLAATARLRAQAESQSAANTRAQVLLEVRQAYFCALGSSEVLKVAQADLASRRLTLRQVRALAQSAMKSTLDVSFAEVAVSEAELEEYHAENDVRAGQARLAAALGSLQNETFELAEEPLPPPLNPNLDTLVSEAMKARPDLAALSLDRDAAVRYADAERRLKYPSINILGVVGEIPVRDAPLHGPYSGAGVNVSIPILNGGLFSARRSQAELKARAAGRDVQDLSVLISRDVRVAWLAANDAFRRLDVTQRLVQEADRALRLAQLRYKAGLGGIVELNQAQLSQTSARIAAASAKYEYLARRAALDFATGALR